MGFSRQEYRSGLPCPPPGDLPDPEIESVSLTSPALAGGHWQVGIGRWALAGGFLTSRATGEDWASRGAVLMMSLFP